MKSLSEIIAWLQTDDKLPVILAEIQGIVAPGFTTLYLSSKPFVSAPTDTNPNIYYDACIVGGINFTESISLTNIVSIGYGDIELDNSDYTKDFWLTDYIWANKNIQLLIGDASWNRDDFRPIFNGTIVDLSSRSPSSLNIILADKLQKLNVPISEVLLPTIDSASEVLIPVTFGEVFNVTPIKSSTIVDTLQYQVHTGPIEDIIEARDNGVPVSITKSLSTGQFTLNQNPYGQITCSVQGAKSGVYYNTISNIIKNIVKNYGISGGVLTDADIDLTNFADFETGNPQPVGVYSASRENMLVICNKLASSVGAQLVFTSTGLLRLIKLSLPPTGTTSYNVGPNDFEYNSISISEKSVVRAATKVSYCKNYTNQRGNIAAGVPSNNKTLFEEESLFESTIDLTVQSNYKLTSEPIAEETTLLKQSDAISESLRRNNLWKEPRLIISFKAFGHLLPVELGDTIYLTDERFGLSGTQAGLVIRISRDWLNNRITIGVLV